MKKQIRITCLLLSVALVLALSACGGPISLPENDSGGQPALNSPGDKGEIRFEEQTVVDNDQCLIKITGIDPDGTWGYTLKVYLENKSADKTYMFSVNSAAVNGVQSDPMFAGEVAPGKKSNEEISFMDDTLRDNGITDYTDIELTFRVYDSDDWSASDVALVTTHVYPRGEENAELFKRQPQPQDNIIVDNEYATVIVTGYDEGGDWGYTVNLFLVNKSDKELMFSVDDASVNGFMADPFYASSVLPGKCAFGDMSWFDSTLEENGITSVDEIDFVLRVYDSDDWSADDYVNETVTLRP